MRGRCDGGESPRELHFPSTSAGCGTDSSSSGRALPAGTRGFGEPEGLRTTPPNLLCIKEECCGNENRPTKQKTDHLVSFTFSLQPPEASKLADAMQHPRPA